jgi:hypothetical protein
MPYKDITYDNGFTERFYFDETEEEEALRMSRINSPQQTTGLRLAGILQSKRTQNRRSFRIDNQ